MGYRRYGEGALRGARWYVGVGVGENGGRSWLHQEPMSWQARHSCDGVRKFGKEGPRRRAGRGERATEVEICGLCCLLL